MMGFTAIPATAYFNSHVGPMITTTPYNPGSPSKMSMNEDAFPSVSAQTWSALEFAQEYYYNLRNSPESQHVRDLYYGTSTVLSC
jgi:hypothetical protein